MADPRAHFCRPHYQSLPAHREFLRRGQVPVTTARQKFLRLGPCGSDSGAPIIKDKVTSRRLSSDRAMDSTSPRPIPQRSDDVPIGLLAHGIDTAAAIQRVTVD